MEKRNLHKVIITLTILLALSTAVMIYISNFRAVAFDDSYYEEQFQKNNIYSRFDPSVNLTHENGVLLDYLWSGEGEINSTFFNAREKTHLIEVRDLYKAVFTLLNIAVVLSIIFMFLLLLAVKKVSLGMTEKEGIDYYKKLISSLLIWIGACVDFIAVFFALVVATFSSSFITFHELLFKTDTWMLDPATDNLIRMFPQQFFYDIFIRIVLVSVVFATILLVVGYVMRLGKPKMLRKG